MSDQPNRRKFIKSVGLGSTAGLVGMAACTPEEKDVSDEVANINFNKMRYFNGINFRRD